MFILVDKLLFKELMYYIFGVMFYRFNIVWYYRLLYGRGVIVFIDIIRCMKVDFVKVDYFFDFIISFYIV